MFRDLKLGLRTALRSPGYSAVAVITMALAIGANTLLFTIASPLVVRPLPITNPEGLGWIRQVNGPRGVVIGGTSMADFVDFRAQARSFSSLAARQLGAGTLLGMGEPRRVNLMQVTANLPQVWGLSPRTGRLFLPGEDEPGREGVGLLSHRFWREAFGEDESIVGRTFSLDGRTVTIVGILGPDIELGNLVEIDLWTPLVLDPASPRDARTLGVVGTLASGVTLEQAGLEMQALAARLAETYPDTNTDWSLNVLSTRSAMTGGDTWVILGLMTVIVVFVLAIACASLANLARARLVGRSQDLEVRKALGASRLQLVRPLVSESVVLGLIGGLAGLGVAHAGLRFINGIAFEPYFRSLAIDQYVLLFNVGLSVLTPLLFSVWPAFSQSRPPEADDLRGARIRGGRAGRRRGRLLIVSQVAMALSLLVVSAMAVQSMWNITNAPIGMDTDRVLAFTLDLPTSRYPDDAARRGFTRTLVDAMSRIPGADAAAVASHLPVIARQQPRRFTGTANDGARAGDQPWASWHAVSAGFFEVTGIPIVAGRGLRDDDTAERQAVAVLNRTAATRYFTDPASAVGRTVRLEHAGAPSTPVTIVGVVEDTRNDNLVATDPQMYVPIDQTTSATLTVVVSSDAPEVRIADARAALGDLDPELAITQPKSMARILAEGTSSGRIINGIFVAFAGLALVLAAAGLYGVISFAVGQRRQEFGVRLALGAEPGTIRSMVLREGLRVSAIGVVIGVILAGALAYASASVLYGISPDDAPTYLGVTAVVMVVAVCAVWIPATRAMRVDPVTALRAD
jgi:putative ABC transport system permease protein